uniref:Uncharacterized protein n=1 Tax=Setaria italica TaxID=4555 RepID=K3Y3V0_SETIT
MSACVADLLLVYMHGLYCRCFFRWLMTSSRLQLKIQLDFFSSF